MHFSGILTSIMRAALYRLVRGALLSVRHNINMDFSSMIFFFMS